MHRKQEPKKTRHRLTWSNAFISSERRQWAAKGPRKKATFYMIKSWKTITPRAHNHNVSINKCRKINKLLCSRRIWIIASDWPEKSGKSKIINTSNRINYGTSTVKPYFQPNKMRLYGECEAVQQKKANKQPKIRWIWLKYWNIYISMIAHFGAVKAQKNPSTSGEKQQILAARAYSQADISAARAMRQRRRDEQSD